MVYVMYFFDFIRWDVLVFVVIMEMNVGNINVINNVIGRIEEVFDFDVWIFGENFIVEFLLDFWSWIFGCNILDWCFLFSLDILINKCVYKSGMGCYKSDYYC